MSNAKFRCGDAECWCASKEERERLFLALAMLAVERARLAVDAAQHDGSTDGRDVEAKYVAAAQPDAIVREFLTTTGTYACPRCGKTTPHAHAEKP